ncbi:deoxycytidylate deaminase [Aliarcobacter butzleri]|uniref:deoxycytidylate deaminase n=1 Tax=Aliarcobacter butzleri TaxID=28197 RepID=UPI0002295C73|nr:deoxycytidylate deaminase [Aliarcobacter butzleri]MCG3688232.1 deoxycytidylate deaminase [Aliarcobacter butzleri]BAK70957.1 deoxycytidylate deaminase [Aliarcobacter butzleri ED-1]
MIKMIYENRKKFIIIGLTGRIGSGCTTTANFLSQEVEDHKLKKICIDDYSNDKQRKKFIIDKFYRKNWNAFKIIRASDVISTFLLKYSFDELNSILKEFKEEVNKVISLIKQGFPDDKINLYNRLKYYNEIITFDESFKEEYNNAYEKFKDLHTELNASFSSLNTKEIYNLITIDLINISKKIKDELSRKSYKNYTDIYQLIGDNIRLYGDIKINENLRDSKNIYIISEYINKFIKKIKKYNDDNDNPTLIAIDAIRNPLEGMFFKERYSAFYLFAINSNDEDIEDRLLNMNNITKEDIKKQSIKENQEKSLESLENFVSQNIQDCISSSDIFIVNNGKYNSDNYIELYGQIIKYVSLIMHPGLITPSLDEKMMQVAYTAKLNSGCLSRQVGASITNEYGSLKAIGWNSVPEGQTPCLLRNINELNCNTKSHSFSIYEKSKEFKGYVKDLPLIDFKNGLNQSFCFKNIYTKNKKNENGEFPEKGNQVHTRSLHAEENAFMQLAKYGSEGIKGGTLYSTASPCELCSKKAYQLGMKRVVYIDPYPGIARKQILSSGYFPPKIDLFKGAIGRAYHKLYEQIIPFKDELNIIEK